MNELISLHYSLQNINSEEGFESVLQTIKSVVNKIDEKLTNSINKLYKVLTTEKIILKNVTIYATRTDTIKRLNKTRNDYLNVVNKQKLNISELSKRYVPVLPGFNAKLSDLSKILVTYIDKASSLPKDLELFTSYLNKYMLSSDANILKHLNIKEKEKLNEEINANLAKLFSTDSITDEKPLKDLVNNINEIKALVVQALTYGKVYNLENLEKITKEYQNLNNVLRNLLDILENSKDKLDKKTKDMLVSYIKIYANYITTISMLYYYYFQFSEMLIAIMLVFIKRDNKNLAQEIKDTTLSLYNNIVNGIQNLFKSK